MNRNSINSLPWPPEMARYPDDGVRAFAAPGSNLVLDFHGDPLRAGLCIFSDGNHHMALEAAVRRFVALYPDVDDVFYTTTPPGPLVDAVTGGGLVVGNLRLNRKPDVFIGPQEILDGLVESGIMDAHAPFAESRGNVLLVRKGNPKGVAGINDLLSRDITLALSNPESEKASYSVYRGTLMGLAHEIGADPNLFEKKVSGDGEDTVFSTTIHHREVPELLAAGRADVAVIYYHLALRYVRIFPEIFEIVGLGGVPDGKRSGGNITTRYHIGLIEGAGHWGNRFVGFMRSKEAQALYEEHGLRGAY